MHSIATLFGGVAHRVNAWLLGVPVSIKVMGIALGITLVLGLGMLWQIHRTWRDLRLQDLDERGRAFAADVTMHLRELRQTGRDTEIERWLRHALSEAPEVAYLILENPAGVVLAEARAGGVNPGDFGLLEFSQALEDAQDRLRVGMSTGRVRQEVGWLTGRVAVTTGIIALLGMLAAWRLTRIFAHPIEELVALTRGVKAGNYEAKAVVRAKDEVGELASAFNEMTEAIGQKEAARQQLLRQVIRAGEEERKRVARELHDQTGQALTSIIAGLGALEGGGGRAVPEGRMVELRHLAEQTLSEVHDLAVALRPSVLDDVGLMAALQRHCRTFGRRLGVDINCAEAGLDDRRLPAEMELTIYRVAQEAITNAVRHGQASRMRVVVHCGEGSVLTTVQDNGCGFDAQDWRRRCLEGNHLGLLGIEERVALLGGSLCVDSTPGKGTAVFADIPLKQSP